MICCSKYLWLIKCKKKLRLWSWRIIISWSDLKIEWSFQISHIDQYMIFLYGDEILLLYYTWKYDIFESEIINNSPKICSTNFNIYHIWKSRILFLKFSGKLLLRLTLYRIILYFELYWLLICFFSMIIITIFMIELTKKIYKSFDVFFSKHNNTLWMKIPGKSLWRVSSLNIFLRDLGIWKIHF